MRIKLALGGKEYVSDALDLAKVTIGECRVIKRETGMTIAQVAGDVSAVR